MNDPGLVALILKQLADGQNTALCTFYECYDQDTEKPRNPLFCGTCDGKDYLCEFYTPKYSETPE